MIQSMPESRRELIERMESVQKTGRFIGIRPSSKKVIEVYSVNGQFVELHFQKSLGLILEIKVVNTVNNLIELRY